MSSFEFGFRNSIYSCYNIFMHYFYAFLMSFVLSIVLTGLARRIGLAYGILSKPRKRDIHKLPLPRIGGPAIFLAFFITVIVIGLIFKEFSFDPIAYSKIDWRLVGIIAGGFFICGSMLLDDLLGLRAWKKLLIQIFATVIVISCGIGIDSLANPFGPEINLNSVYIPLFVYQGVTYHFSLWSDLLTLIWLVGMMNVMNFVDGVDGLAGGLSVIAFITIFLLSIVIFQPATAFVSIIIAGAVLGFLIWNFPPAKIFMGDSGSMFIGFMAGVLTLISGGKLATVFLVLGLPIVDGLVVAVGRLFRGKNPLNTPDKTHLHHRFLDAGFSTRQAIVAMYVIAAAFGWVALRSSTLNKIIAALVLVAIVLSLIIFLIYLKKRRCKLRDGRIS